MRKMKMKKVKHSSDHGSEKVSPHTRFVSRCFLLRYSVIEHGIVVINYRHPLQASIHKLK